MKFWKNGVIISVVILFIILISGCSGTGAGTEPINVLDGTWTLSTSLTAGGNVGSGTFTQTFYDTMEMLGITFDVYIGSGLLSGGDYDDSYDVGGSDVNGAVIFTFTDADGDCLYFDGTVSGSTVTGTYDGDGKYLSDSGIFTATRQ